MIDIANEPFRPSGTPCPCFRCDIVESRASQCREAPLQAKTEIGAVDGNHDIGAPVEQTAGEPVQTGRETRECACHIEEPHDRQVPDRKGRHDTLSLHFRAGNAKE